MTGPMLLKNDPHQAVENAPVYKGRKMVYPGGWQLFVAPPRRSAARHRRELDRNATTGKATKAVGGSVPRYAGR